MVKLDQAIGTTLLVYAAFFIFYTGYNKSSRKIDFNLLFSVLFFQKGAEFTLMEVNKVLALAGLTLLGLSAIVQGVLWHAAISLWLHWGISLAKYYGSSKLPGADKFASLPGDLLGGKNRGETMKKLSFVFGFLAQMALLNYLGFIPINVGSIFLFAIFFGIAHFLLMESDTSFNLKVRPAGYVALFIPLVVLVIGFFR